MIGSAARLLRKESLHHCTLLVDANVDTLNKVLSSAAEIDTNATRSLRVDVKCLSEVGISDIDELCRALEPHWSRGYRVQGGQGIELVDPCDISDIQQKIDELKTWKEFLSTS